VSRQRWTGGRSVRVNVTPLRGRGSGGQIESAGGGAEMLENRRKYSRVPMRAQVTCIVASRTMRGVSWNLGEGGMQVEASGLHPKEAVQLSFRLPSSGVAVDAVGAVVWGDEKRHGIQFTYRGAQSQQSILEYIAEQMEH
jgi:hypothetical protein